MHFLLILIPFAIIAVLATIIVRRWLAGRSLASDLGLTGLEALRLRLFDTFRASRTLIVTRLGLLVTAAGVLVDQAVPTITQIWQIDGVQAQAQRLIPDSWWPWVTIALLVAADYARQAGLKSGSGG